VTTTATALRRRVPGALNPFARARQTVLGRNPGLARMLLAGFISTCGDRLHQVALAALVLGATDSLASAGLVFVVSTLPYALFGLPVGALIDRCDRRTAMVAGDAVRAVLVMLIPLAASVSLPLVYCLLFALTCATMFFNPARQAAIPDMVAAEDLAEANTFFQAMNYTVDLLAFPLAGVIVAVLIERLQVVRGTQVAFGFDAMSYLLSGALLLRLRLPMPMPIAARAARAATEPLGRIPRQVGDGVRYLMRNQQLRTNTLLMTIGPLLLGSLHTLWIGFAWRVSHTGTFGYGVTETSNAIGTLIGLVVLRTLVVPRLNPGRAILLGFAIMGAAIAAASLSDSLVVVAGLAALSGLGNMLFLVPSVTLAQRHTPSELRGRVFAVRLMLTYSAFSVSNALAGAMSDVIGVSVLFGVLGGAMLLLALAGSLAPSAREAI
jgi:MFS family permease